MSPAAAITGSAPRAGALAASARRRDDGDAAVQHLRRA
jgi:hypothetical protein